MDGGRRPGFRPRFDGPQGPRFGNGGGGPPPLLGPPSLLGPPGGGPPSLLGAPPGGPPGPPGTFDEPHFGGPPPRRRWQHDEGGPRRSRWGGEVEFDECAPGEDSVTTNEELGGEVEGSGTPLRDEPSAEPAGEAGQAAAAEEPGGEQEDAA